MHTIHVRREHSPDVSVQSTQAAPHTLLCSRAFRIHYVNRFIKTRHTAHNDGNTITQLIFHISLDVDEYLARNHERNANMWVNENGRERVRERDRMSTVATRK